MSDLIRRDDAINAMMVLKRADDLAYGCEIPESFDSERAIESLNHIPFAEPERKKGRWQRRKDEDCWECSQCHAVLENDDLGMHNFYFCYHCGANMMNKSGYMDIEEAGNDEIYRVVCGLSALQKDNAN